MKVLQITTNYPTKDNPIFGIFMKEQVESLERYGVENRIFFSDGSSVGVKKHHGAIKVHAWSSLKLFFHLLTHRYDVIHCHSVISGLILLLSGGAFFNKCVVSFQNDPHKDMDGRHFKRLYRFFNKVIVKIPTYLELEKVNYIPNGCNIDFFRPLDKNECKRKLGLDPQKRYILFVDSNTAKKRTQKRRDRFDGVMEILREKYGYTDIEPLVMIGVGRNDVPLYFNSCDLHLLTSDQEGSPNSVKECLCCNVPVVATNVGNVSDLLDGMPECRVSATFEPEDIAADVDYVLRYEDEVKTRDAMIKKALDKESVAKKIISVYNSIVKEKKRIKI